MTSPVPTDHRTVNRVEFCSWKQQEFVFDQTSEALLYSGAFGGGKTQGICEKLTYNALAYPGCVQLVTRKKMKWLRSTTLQKFLRIVDPRLYRHNQSSGRIDFINGSRVWWRGMDDPQNVASIEDCDAVMVDEAIDLEEEDWIMLEGRLRGKVMPHLQISGATNPGPPTHFLFKRFYRERQGRVLQTNSNENRFLPRSYRIRLSRFQGQFKQRFVDGLWITMEGIIYPIFSDGRHLVDRRKIPKEWPRFGVIDFGYTNPFCFLLAAQAPSGQIVVYREIYMSHRTVNDHAAAIKRIIDEEEIYPEAIWADHDAGDRAILARAGISTKPAQKDVSTGIQRVYTTLLGGPDGPGIVFMRGMLEEVDPRLKAEGRPYTTTEEFYSYAWKQSPDGKPIPEEPQKVNDHGMDAIRYLLAGIERYGSGFFAGTTDEEDDLDRELDEEEEALEAELLAGEDE